MLIMFVRRGDRIRRRQANFSILPDQIARRQFALSLWRFSSPNCEMFKTQTFPVVLVQNLCQKMSTYVGWYFGGSVQVFDESTEETTFHNITEVDVNSGIHDKALDELQNIVKVEDVKQLVFVHNGFNTKSCKSIVEKLTEKGFKSVYIQHWISNYFQTFLLKQNVEFTEGQHFLLAIKGKNEYPVVWRYCSERIEFVKIGPEIPPSESNLSSYFHETIPLFNNFKVKLMINMECVQICGIVKNLFPECKIVDNAPLTADDVTATALWTAKRRDDLVDGVEVGNYCRTRLKLRVGADPVKYETKFIPLPFKWSSEWKHCESASTVFAADEEFDCNFKLPAKRRFRIIVQIDRNGLHKVEVELKCILGISLSQDSFYLTRSADSVNGKVISIGQFPTALRFDCDPPKLTFSVSGENVIADAIEMLDPSKEEKNGWKCFTTLGRKKEFFKTVETDDGSKVVTASYVVSELFNDIRSLITDANLDDDQVSVVAISRFFTQEVTEGLLHILQSNELKLCVIEELSAVAYGYSVENGQESSVTLIVDLRATGCYFSVIKIEDHSCLQCVKHEVDDLKSEEVRRAIRMLFTDTSLSDRNLKTEDEIAGILNAFRIAVFDAVGDERLSVQDILLIGSCCLVPKLTEVLSWAFFGIDISTIDETEVQRLSAVGAASLSVRPQCKTFELDFSV